VNLLGGWASRADGGQAGTIGQSEQVERFRPSCLAAALTCRLPAHRKELDNHRLWVPVFYVPAGPCLPVC
jgi:hypothetical protein